MREGRNRHGAVSIGCKWAEGRWASCPGTEHAGISRPFAGPRLAMAARSLAALAPAYRPRRPTETVLYAVVRDHLESFLAHARERDGSFPRESWFIPRKGMAH